jgi:hypothetical protein
MKRCGRDKPIWAAEIHICMVTTLGISLYNYLYLKPAKMLYFSYYLLCFLFNKFREQEGRRSSVLKLGLGESRKEAQIMYIHVSKCKSNKIKFLKR